nr:isoaspartyl peptidase/L-asparaginase [Paludifilum halophilum]
MDISALVRYKNPSVEQAASQVVKNKLRALGGTGGVIVIDRKGRFAFPHSSKGMFYGYVTNKEKW